MPAERLSAVFFLGYFGSMAKVEIFIDGANFHHLVLKKIGVAEIQFDFSGFASFLADGRQFTEMGKRFYIGAVR